MSKRRPWTGADLVALRRDYPTLGGPHCAKLFDRALTAIHSRAQKLGLRSAHMIAAPVAHTEHTDRAIRQGLQGEYRRGALNKVALALGWSIHTVKKRALKLGIMPARSLAPRPWVDEELAIVQAHARRRPDVIAERLKRRGFSRTAVAVAALISGSGRIDRRAGDYLSASDVAACFGVQTSNITRLVREGYLKAERQGSTRGDKDPYLIHQRDIAQFIVSHPALVDLRKVDKFWFIDLLNRHAGQKAKPIVSTERRLIAALQADPDADRAVLAERLGASQDQVGVAAFKARRALQEREAA